MPEEQEQKSSQKPWQGMLDQVNGTFAAGVQPAGESAGPSEKKPWHEALTAAQQGSPDEPSIFERADTAISNTLAPNPQNYESLAKTNLVEVPKTLGREVYSGAKTILGMVPGIYHAFADEATPEEREKYAEFEKEHGEAPGTETSGLKRIGLGLGRVTGANDAEYALHSWADPKTRPTLQSTLDVAPEAIGSGAGVVVGGKLVEGAAPTVKKFGTALPRAIKVGVDAYRGKVPVGERVPVELDATGENKPFAGGMDEPLIPKRKSIGSAELDATGENKPFAGGVDEWSSASEHDATGENKPYAGGWGRIKVSATAPEVPITRADVKSSPGTSMGPEQLVPVSGPLGKVSVEELTPQVPTAEEPKPTATEKSAAEYHPDIKQRITELSNVDLRTLGESFDLDPSEYDFAKREPLREGGSKHPVQRIKFVNDLIERIPDSWIEKFGRLSDEAKQRQGIFPDKDVTSQKRAQQSRSIFRDRLGIPQATQETREMNEADLLKHGFVQKDIDAGLHLPSVGGGASSGMQSGVTATADPGVLAKRWGVDEGSLVRGREQTRTQTSGTTEQQIQSLIKAYQAGQPVEPVVEIRDQGNNIVEVDGRMRVMAAKRAGIKNIPVVVKRALPQADLVPTARKTTGVLGSAVQ